MHLNLQVVHKVPDHVDGCAAVRVRVWAASETGPERGGQYRAFARNNNSTNAFLHTSAYVCEVLVMSENVCTDKP